MRYESTQLSKFVVSVSRLKHYIASTEVLIILITRECYIMKHDSIVCRINTLYILVYSSIFWYIVVYMQCCHIFLLKNQLQTHMYITSDSLVIYV